MEYIIILLEGIITFLSPCMLPMLPIYISYFAGQKREKNDTLNTIINVCAFILGFTFIFTILAIFSATIGIYLKMHRKIINIVLGILVIVFGLGYLNVIKINNISIKSKSGLLRLDKLNFLSSFAFGIIFAITWSPCVGAFLGTALSIIAINGKIVQGILLILTYCIGLGIPFVLSTLLLNKLKNTFESIKKHYNVINRICGLFLCIIGLLMITGLIEKYFTYIT